MAIEYFGKLSRKLTIAEFSIICSNLENPNSSLVKTQSELSHSAKITFKNNVSNTENVLIEIDDQMGYICIYNASSNQREELINNLTKALEHLGVETKFEED